MNNRIAIRYTVLLIKNLSKEIYDAIRLTQNLENIVA